MTQALRPRILLHALQERGHEAWGPQAPAISTRNGSPRLSSKPEAHLPEDPRPR